jgi:hypothetical protein
MPSVPAPDLRRCSDDEIWHQLHSGMVDSDLHKQCVLTIQLRNLERQTKASSDLVTATDRSSLPAIPLAPSLLALF